MTSALPSLLSEVLTLKASHQILVRGNPIAPPIRLDRHRVHAVLVQRRASAHAPRRTLLRQRQVQVDVELLAEQLVDGGAVAQVHPVADGCVLLLRLALAKDDVVVALGARLWRRQPDLLVGGLFVDYVCAEVGKRDV